MGNALSWFKEYALRSQTADALAGVKEQAHADASQMLGALQERQWNVEDQTAKADTLLANEEIQQAGLTERERIQERIKAAERAAAFTRQRGTDLNTDIDNLWKITDEKAVDEFVNALRGMGREIPEGIATAKRGALQAAREAKTKDETEKATADSLRFGAGLSTEAAVRSWLKSNPELAKDPRAQALILDAKAKDAERYLRNREKPEKPEVGEKPLTPEARLSYEKRFDDLEDMRYGLKPGDPRLKRINDQQREIKRMLAVRPMSGGGVTGSALANKLIEIMNRPTPGARP